LLEKLSAPLRDLVTDIEQNAADTIRKVREESPAKYLELAAKLLPLIAELNPTAKALDLGSARSLEDIGRRLLISVGCDEFTLSEAMIKEAVESQ
jgi:hypothetical protein